MDDNQRPLFQGMDEQERVYAPEELAPDDPRRKRVEADEHSGDRPGYEADEPDLAMPVANIGDAPSSGMAPVEPESEERRDASGNPVDRGDNPLYNDNEPADKP